MSKIGTDAFLEIMNNDRLIAIGDIHGNIKVLELILEAIDPQPQDTLVFLGDFCNRGDTKKVIDKLIELSQKCKTHFIMGNHEEMILHAYQGGSSEHNFFCKFGGIQTLSSYGIGHIKEMPHNHVKFIIDTIDYLELDDHIFVHAGYHSKLPLEKTSSQDLRWQPLVPNQPKHMSGKTIVCGHTCQKQIYDIGHLICIDTGCGVWPGGRLSAIDLKSGTIWQAGNNSKKVKIKQREIKS